TLSPTMTGTPTPFDTPDLSATPEMSVTATLPPTLGPSSTALPPLTTTPTPSGYGYNFGGWPLPPVDPYTLPATPLENGQPIDVTFTGEPNEVYVFSFYANHGDVISAGVLSDNPSIDTAMSLHVLNSISVTD